jgi:hypothetical protein
MAFGRPILAHCPRMRQIRWGVLAALLVLPPPASVAAPRPDLAVVLERAGQYVLGFEERFALVIGDERYDQHKIGGAMRLGNGSTIAPPQDRTIESEMLFLWLSGERAWLAVRNVLTVDGGAVDGSQQRLDRLLASTAPIGLARLRQLRNESARFNIGTIRRNFNDPMSPLRFLEPESRRRFGFALAGEETVNGVVTSKVTFNEEARPTFIQNSPSHGMIWIAADGAIVRTRLEVGNRQQRLTASIVVDYRRDQKLDMMVPVTMREIYTALAAGGATGALGPVSERIECDAKYSNYRRFETAGRIVPD